MKVNNEFSLSPHATRREAERGVPTTYRIGVETTFVSDLAIL
jgi:hypothetical protein